MLFFIAPFVWMLAVPAVFLLILLIRTLLWLRSLGRPEAPRAAGNDPSFIEGEFVDSEAGAESEDGSPPPRNPLEK